MWHGCDGALESETRQPNCSDRQHLERGYGCAVDVQSHPFSFLRYGLEQFIVAAIDGNCESPEYCCSRPGDMNQWNRESRKTNEKTKRLQLLHDGIALFRPPRRSTVFSFLLFLKLCFMVFSILLTITILVE
jgi:hypothetical protein